MFLNCFQIFGAKLIVLFDFETHPPGVARWLKVGFQLNGLSGNALSFQLIYFRIFFVSQLQKLGLISHFGRNDSLRFIVS